MADRSVIVRLSANVQGLVNGLRTGTRAMDDFAGRGLDAVNRNKEGINTLANGAGALGLALVGVAGTAVKAFADFDQAMSGVEATGSEAKASINELSDAALAAGAATKYSATEAANAIEEMAKAGVSTADILGGGLNGALALAAAGEIEVADAAAIASTTMNQFGLEGKDVGRIADVLAASAGKANGEVADFGLAMKYVGPVASQLGVSLEETSGTLALLAENGILADSAGTGLRGVLMSLTAPTKIAQTALDEYGISAFDAQGEFVGLSSLAGQLQTKLGGLTEAERSAALGRMFGNEQITTARILYANGASAVEDWTAAVDDQGFAAEVAATKMDNLKGDIEQFTGALETAFIQAGAGGNDMLRSLVQGATDAVNAFGALPKPVQETTMLIAGGAGLALLGAAGLAKLVVGVSEAKIAISGLGITANTARLAVVGIGAALGIAAVGLTTWIAANAAARARVEELAGTLDQMTGALTDNTDAWIAEKLAAEQSFGVLGVGNMKSMVDVADELGVSVETLTSAYQGNADAIDTAKAAAVEYEKANPWSVQAEAKSQRFITNLEDQRSRLDEAKESTAQKQAVDEAAGGAQDDLADSYAGTTTAVEEQTDALGDMIEAQREASGIVLSVRDAQVQMEGAVAGVAGAIEDQIAALAAQKEASGESKDAARAHAEAEVAVADKLDITTEAGRNNRTALDDVADAGWELLESMEANGATQEELQGTMQVTRDRFIAAAGQMGMTQEAATALADEIGLIPAAVYTHVEIETDAAQQRIDAWMERNRNRKLTVEVEATGSGSAVYRTAGGTRFEANGGYIAGPGTSTSDSIPARLSNGEYVIRASAVSQYGRAFFDAVNAKKFAAGGMVGPAAASSNSGSGGTGPLVIEGTLDLGNGLVGMMRGVAVEVGRLSSARSR